MSIFKQILGMSGENVTYSKQFSEEKEGETPIYRNENSFNGLLMTPDNECYTILYGEKNFLGTIDSSCEHYNWKSFSSIRKIAENLGSSIIEKKLFTRVNDFENFDMNLIGILSKNREEWLILEYANFLYRNTMVPLYDTLGPKSVQHILDQTKMQTIFLAKEGIESILKTEKLSKLKNIVLFDETTEENKQLLQKRGLKVYEFQELLHPAKIYDYVKTIPDDIATFVYTSGTTGDPKGVLISHKNLVSVIATAKTEGFMTSDVYYSYLPLPHILERVSVSTYLYFGMSIGFYRGDIKHIKDDLQVLKPTIFAGVPRIYTRIYEGIKEEFSKQTGIKGWFIKKGLNQKQENVKKNNIFNHGIWDKLIFNKVKQVLGGNIRMAITGGAPMSQEVLIFMRAALGIPILEGYGQAESTGACFNTSALDGSVGHIGGCRANMEFKLVDLPDMGYTSKDVDEDGNPTPRGEICVRGFGVFPGYYKMKDKTNEIIDELGWLKSGDIGQIDPKRGCLTVIDRKKNIFKLAQGEYIAPDKIENIYLKADGIEEVFVYGDSEQNYLVGIVVPKQGFADKKILLNNMTEKGKAEGLQSFEQVKNIHIFEDSFKSIDCMTDTLKMKRKECRDYFRKEIDEMYKDKEQSVAPS